MGAYMASLHRIAHRPDGAVFLPGHGDPMRDPATRLAALIDPPPRREAQILAALGRPGHPETLARASIPTCPPAAPAAARQRSCPSA
jgi:glyoxylase-like metal-dependent hydrolase (beta-lactamase superfamily II)